MQIVRTKLVAVVLLGLALAACTGSKDAPVLAPTPAAPSDVAATGCTPPLRLCLACDQTTRFCARFCPECPAPLAPGSESVPATLALRGPACVDQI